MPYIYIPSSTYGGNSTPAMPGFTSAGPDPRKRQRQWTAAELRAEELAREKHRDEMRAIYEERRAKEAERKKLEEADRAARRHERNMQDPVVAKMYADRAATQKMFADRKAASEAFNKLSPEEKKAEIARQRAENKAAMDRTVGQARAKEGLQTIGYQPDYAQDANVVPPTQPAASRVKAGPAPLPYSERMAQPTDAAPSAQYTPRPASPSNLPPEVAKKVQAVADTVTSLPSPARKAPAPAARPAPRTATAEAGSLFEEAKKSNPNMTASEFFAARPDLISKMQAEQNPTAGWSINQPAAPRPAVAPRNFLGGVQGPAEQQYLAAHQPVGGGVSQGTFLNPRTGKVEKFADPLGHTMAVGSDVLGAFGEGLGSAAGGFYDYLAELLNNKKPTVRFNNSMPSSSAPNFSPFLQ